MHRSTQDNGRAGGLTLDVADAEAALVGAILADPSILADVRAMVPADAIAESRYGLIYRTCCALADERVPIDLTTIGTDLAKYDLLKESDAVRTIADLLTRTRDGVLSAAYWRQYARDVVGAYHARLIRRAGLEAAREIEERPAEVAQVVERLRERIESIDATGSAGRLEMIDSAAFDQAKYDLRYLIDGLLVDGQPCVLVGAKKTLKTNLAIDLAIGLATARKFAGHWWVPEPVNVGMFSAESGAATLQETARRIADSKGVRLSDCSGLRWCFAVPDLSDSAQLAEFGRAITRHAIRLAIIDPAYLAFSDIDPTNIFEMGKLLRRLTEVGQDTGATILVVHHMKRGGVDPFAPPELESIAFAGWQEWARQWLLLGRRERYNPDAPGSHRLWLSVGGSAGHCGLWGLDIEEGARTDPGGRRWGVEVISATDAIDQQAAGKRSTKADDRARERDAILTERREKIIDILRRYPLGETETVIRQKTGMSGTTFGPPMEDLLRDGTAERARIVKGKRTWDGYRLAGHPDTRTRSPGQAVRLGN